MVRNVVMVIVLALVAGFTLLNWSALSAPMALSLGIGSVEAPLGLVMLAIVALLCILFAAWAITMQATVLAETRRHTKELQAQRELADTAEASRFVELRDFVGAELQRSAQETRTTLEQTGNTLVAHLGQIEDRLDRERFGPSDVPRAEDARLPLASPPR